MQDAKEQLRKDIERRKVNLDCTYRKEILTLSRLKDRDLDMTLFALVLHVAVTTEAYMKIAQDHIKSISSSGYDAFFSKSNCSTVCTKLEPSLATLGNKSVPVQVAGSSLTIIKEPGCQND